MPDLHSLEKLRPCGMDLKDPVSEYCLLTNPSGNLEKFSTARHHLGFYNNVGCSAAYTRLSSELRLENLIFHALRMVINQHPVLSAIPVDEDTKSPYFVRLPEVDLRTCLEFVERSNNAAKDDEPDVELDEVVAAQHNKNFKEEVGSRPFWRLVILHKKNDTRTFTASWIYHHAIGDGTSGLVFHRSFLAALRSIDAKEASTNVDPVVKPPRTPLLPALEDSHPLPLSMSYLAKAQWADWFPKKKEGLWAGGKITSDPEAMKTHFTTRVFSKDTTQKLVRLSRENKTSLTGTLQCLVAAALLFNLDATQYNRLHVDGAISLRRFLTLPDQANGQRIDDQIGTWSSQYLYDHKRLTTKAESVLDLFSWDEAKRVREEITKELNKNLKDSVVGLLRFVSNVHGYFSKKVGGDRTDSFEFSNVGVFEPWKWEEGENDGAGSGGEKWNIGRVVFSQCAPVAGAAFEVSVVTGGDECLVLGFSWAEGVVETKLLEGVMESLRDGVEGLVRA